MRPGKGGGRRLACLRPRAEAEPAGTFYMLDRSLPGDEALRAALKMRTLSALLDQQQHERARAIELATEIAQSGPLAIVATRETLRRGLAEAVARATEREYEEQDWLRKTDDFREGTKAMGERRLPNFQSR